jgi:hypothetical protein
VGIRKLHAVRSQTVHVRRRDFRVGVVGANVSTPEIVGKDKHDVGRALSRLVHVYLP